MPKIIVRQLVKYQISRLLRTQLSQSYLNLLEWLIEVLEIHMTAHHDCQI